MPGRQADDPLQFVLEEDARSSVSSHTESLLQSTATDRTPGARPTLSDERDDDEDEKGTLPSYHDSDVEMLRHPRSSSFEYDYSGQRSAHATVIHVPTRQEIQNALAHPRRRPQHPRFVALGAVALLGFAWLATTVLSLGTRFGRTGPRIQVILMVSDGMGPASQTMSREFLQFLHDESSVAQATKNKLNESVWSKLDSGFQTERFGKTPLDDILVGASRTRSSSSLITDSAAGATAFSCAIKTYNGAIAVNPQDKKPCGTILEAAKRQGFATGLVATSRITHATPAAFYAHVVDRDLESEIATFLVGNGPKGQVVDFALGGGQCFFLPNSSFSSCRTDDLDQISEAEKNGYAVLRGIKELREWHDKAGHEGSPVIGLFADDHMHYEIDRQQIEHLADEQPSLREMASHALQYLRAVGDGGKGFFLMIEGSRIDMAAHNNDPIGHLSDMLAYHDTVRFVKEWVDNANEEGTPTVLISVSDHETGGLSLGRQLTSAYPEYVWYPDALANATHSTSYLGALIANTTSVSRSWLRDEVYGKGLGIADVTDGEINELWPYRYDAYRANRVLADAVGWSTAGHSGVDVNLYASGVNASGIAGNVENTDIGEHIAHMMGLNLDVVTLELNKNLGWHHTTLGNSPSNSKNRTQVAHYHGDF
ncbi:vacuolar alkaline phosphatase [Microbotryomycetes sp. JL201]|nr:vacuolar alkaline phosphatase [Microbotryomycetes sp. JL201]